MLLLGVFFGNGIGAKVGRVVLGVRLLVWSVRLTVWIVRLTIWMVRLLVWMVRLTVWMMRLTVWMLRLTVWMLRLIVWMLRLIVWMLRTGFLLGFWYFVAHYGFGVLTFYFTPKKTTTVAVVVLRMWKF